MPSKSTRQKPPAIGCGATHLSKTAKGAAASVIIVPTRIKGGPASFGLTSGCAPSTVRVSVTNTPNPETEANDFSDYPAISGDGHYVVFLSSATNLVPGGTNGYSMVFLAKTGF